MSDAQQKRPRSDSISSGPDSKRPNNAKTDMDVEPSTATDNSKVAEATAAAASSSEEAPAKNTYITIRALIVTQDASIIIGKAGAHIKEIRENSGAKLSVSEAIKGCQERVLYCSGPLDAVSKGYGLVVRRINDEPFDQPSVPGSRAVTVRFIIPNAQIGMVIGKGGTKIREIQEASGAKLQASEAMLPESTDRLLTISGVADAVHIAIYYVGTVLLDFSGNLGDNRQYRPSPRPQVGGRPLLSAPFSLNFQAAPAAASASSRAVWTTTANDPTAQVQQLFIPEQYISAIIGPKGRSINEIRASSATTIKILEPHEQEKQAAKGAPGERLVSITGNATNLQMAVQMLYARLEEVKSSQQSR